jgi:GAF domain-containing protein
MLAGNELRGVLYVESPTPKNFNESDERLLQGLADMAVVALQNAHAYDREKRLAEEAQVLNQISKEITSQLDHVHVFNLIIEKALELTHAGLGAFLLYDSESSNLRIVAERGLTEDKKGTSMGLHQGIVGYVARSKHFVNVDVSQSPWKEMYVELTPGARSELAVPLLAGSEPRGVLNVESPNPNNFGESDERLLQGLADLAVVALQNAESYEQARREAQRFELLYKAGQELGKITELSQLEQAYSAVVQIAREYSQSLVVIRLYDEATQELVMIGTSQPSYSPLFERQKLHLGVNGQVAQERCTIVVADTKNPPLGVVTPQLSDPTIRSLLITPIIFKERYYGNLGLSNKEIRFFRAADVKFLEGLAQQLASTIYRLETVQERQEFEQRAASAETMSWIGQAAFELTHRWDNNLGLVRSYVNDIRSEHKKLGVTNSFIDKKLENIVQDTRTVLDLSKNLRQEFARSGESSAIIIEPVIIHPRILLEEAMSLPSFPTNIHIGLEIDKDVTVVRVFHHLVADILRNLMTNAIESMPEGGKITLRARNHGLLVAFEVTDTGVGIPQQDLGKVFGLFFSTKGSSGFGLWSARCNALRNHGDLEVKSEPSQGTTFTLFLPRVRGREHESTR